MVTARRWGATLSLPAVLLVAGLVLAFPAWGDDLPPPPEDPGAAAAERAEAAAARAEAAAERVEDVARRLEEEVDRALKRALEAEYGDLDDDELPPPRRRLVHPRHRYRERVAPPPPSVVVTDGDEPRRRAVLSLLGGLQAAKLTRLRVTDGFLGEAPVDLDEVLKFDRVAGYLGNFTLSLHKHVDIIGGGHVARFDDTQIPAENFQFDGLNFDTWGAVKTKVTSVLADLDLRINIVNHDIFLLGVHVGARYAYLRTEAREIGSDVEAKSTLDSAMPMVGLSMVFRPVRVFEIFGTVRVGGYDFENHHRDRDDYHHHYSTEDYERKRREAGSIVLDVGAALVLADAFGIVVGYRCDSTELRRRDETTDERGEWDVEGAYGAVLVRF